MEKVECPHCGASEVGWEGSCGFREDDSTQRVCRECGTILEEGSFQKVDTASGGYQDVPVNIDHAPTGTESTSLPKDSVQDVAPAVSISAGQKLGKQKIKQLFQFIEVEGKHFQQEAIEMYSDVLKTSVFKYQLLQNKEYIAGACVMVVCRNHDMPVTATMVCMLLNCDEIAFNTEFIKIQKVLDIKLKQLDVDALVETLCDGHSMALVKRTKQVLAIARKTWITEGRYRDTIIMAANFFAWQSLDDQYSRFKVTLRTYGKEQGWTHSVRLLRRYNDIGMVLCSLASAIPWLTKSEISIKNVTLHLNDIIKYQKSLFRQIQPDEDDDEVTPVEKNSPSPEGSTESVPTGSHSESARTLTTNLDTSHVPDTATASELHTNAKQSTGKRLSEDISCTYVKNKMRYFNSSTDAKDMICKPPSSLYPAKLTRKETPIAYHSNLNSEKIGEEDISESDIIDYIKHDHEIAEHFTRKKP